MIRLTIVQKDPQIKLSEYWTLARRITIKIKRNLSLIRMGCFPLVQWLWMARGGNRNEENCIPHETSVLIKVVSLWGLFVIILLQQRRSSVFSCSVSSRSATWSASFYVNMNLLLPRSNSHRAVIFPWIQFRWSKKNHQWGCTCLNFHMMRLLVSPMFELDPMLFLQKNYHVTRAVKELEKIESDNWEITSYSITISSTVACKMVEWIMMVHGEAKRDKTCQKHQMLFYVLSQQCSIRCWWYS